MAIIVTLSPKIEALLREKAVQQDRDISLVASELLTSALEWEAKDLEKAREVIQKGLDDFKAGRYRAFHEFAEAQRRKYDLPADA